MAEFILELYSEEIPAGMQSRAMDNLARLVMAVLTENNIAPATVKTYAAPQRLALMLDGLPVATEARKIEKKGPKIDAPKQALDGFLRANGLSDVSALKVQSHAKGDFYILESDEKGQSVAGLLADALPCVIENFPWPKSMRWGSGKLRWVRPLRAILCRFDGAVVPFEVGDLTAGGVTYGHRFMAPDAIEITSIADYLPKLEAAFVMADPVERRTKIINDTILLAYVHEVLCAEDDALLTEVAGLVEWPVCLMGKIDDKFMDVPDEVLTSVMRTHQKYFTVLDGKTGNLAPRFIAVSNMETEDSTVIIAGNERVLRARLSDAKFFWDKDRETSLEKNLPALDNIIFHAKLGSVGDKVRRLERLAVSMTDHLALSLVIDVPKSKAAARLCKADLVSGMVSEFPELQGIMGGHYAQIETSDEEIGVAIRDHYKPQGPSDDVPPTAEGCAVALADKLDTLVGFWLIDEKPTGSKDPYALRRAALGIIRIIVEKEIFAFDLEDLIGNALDFYQSQNHESASAQRDEITENLKDFFMTRIKVYLRDKKNIAPDIVDAVAYVHQVGFLNIVDLCHRAGILHTFLKTKDGDNLRRAYKRAYGICHDQVILNLGTPLDGGMDFSFDVGFDDDGENSPEDSKDLFIEDEEKNLHQAIKDCIANNQGLSLEKCFENLATLRKPVDDFFENIVVNVEDKKIRKNRMEILGLLVSAMRQYAAFELLEGGDDRNKNV